MLNKSKIIIGLFLACSLMVTSACQSANSQANKVQVKAFQDSKPEENKIEKTESENKTEAKTEAKTEEKKDKTESEKSETEKTETEKTETEKLDSEKTETEKTETEAKTEETNNNSKPDPTKPMVAITFDDGPRPESTNRILDTLAKYKAKATFFVIGSSAETYPHTLLREYKEGHEIGNHSYAHPDFTTLSYDQIRYQVDTTQAVIQSITGEYPSLFRVPYGALSDSVTSSVGMPFIQWSIDSRDWELRDGQLTSEKVLPNVQDGDIILLHDIHNPTADAVDIIVPELVARGYQLVTVSELYKSRGGSFAPGYIYRFMRNE